MKKSIKYQFFVVLLELLGGLCCLLLYKPKLTEVYAIENKNTNKDLDGLLLTYESTNFIVELPLRLNVLVLNNGNAIISKTGEFYIQNFSPKGIVRVSDITVKVNSEYEVKNFRKLNTKNYKYEWNSENLSKENWKSIECKTNFNENIENTYKFTIDLGIRKSKSNEFVRGLNKVALGSVIFEIAWN